MDQIIQGYLKDFAADFNLEDAQDATLFEHFVNYCVVAPELAGPPDLAEVHVGAGDDTGLDGVAIIVNDHLLTSKEQFDDLRKHRARLEVTFLFSQAKSSPRFDGSEIGTFLFGVQEFFNPTTTMPANENVSRLRGLAKHVFDASIDFRRNPDCMLYYASTGEWHDDPRHSARINQDIERLRRTSLFSRVQFYPLDAARLKSTYKNLKRRLVQEIEFERHSILPRLDHRVTVAYIGILPVDEYIRLITAPDGRLNKAVFYENIRDFQGDTPVNNEIRETIVNSESQNLLPILNNGITVVAQAIDVTGTTFRLTDFQVVNGCQTSHAIFNAKDAIGKGVYIPIKLIATVDKEVTTRVIRATNRQTEIKAEAFVALSPFHKELEDLYASLAKGSTHPLYYERRSRQYEGSSIRSHQIVTLAAQVASFTAVFLEEPHSCHRYYGELIGAYRDRLFKDTHRLLPYYLSSFILYRLEGMFRMSRLPTYLRPFRYHIAMLVRLSAGKGSLPPLDSKKMDRYCEGALEAVSDNRRAGLLFEAASERVKKEIQHLQQTNGDVQGASRIRAFTQALLAR